MIGIVVVSHSNALAKAVIGLAAEMVPESARPKIASAAGLDETTFGTDAMAVAEAIAEVDSADGVLVLLDLGSAILSAEMALEFVDPEVAERVRLTPAPLVEGLVAAVVTAATGATLAEVETEALAGLAGKQGHLGVATTALEPNVLEPSAPKIDLPPTQTLDQGESPAESNPDGEYQPTTITWLIRNEHGLHARPAATLVSGMRGFDAEILAYNTTLGTGPAPITSLMKVTTLELACGNELQVSFAGPDASAAKAKFLSLAATDFGEAPAGESALPTPPANVKSGLQIVIGPALVPVTEIDISDYQPGDITLEKNRWNNTLDEVTTQLQALSQGEQGAIFAAQLCLLDDDSFAGEIARAIALGQPATTAVTEASAKVAASFDELSDPYLQERGQDVRAIGRMLLQSLVGEPFLTEGDDEPSVLVITEIDAATANALDPATCLGIITCTGGATGHGVIVASSKGIPVLTGRPLAATLTDGELVAFDPVSGELWLRPEAEVVARLEQAAAIREAAETTARDTAAAPAVTQSGHRILVEANLSSLSDAEAALGADGSGLVRTELLFAEAKTAPTAAQQAAVFIALGKAIGGPITIRTWDVGGDKPLPFLPGSKEENPFLGVRGIRMMRQAPDVFREQLRAIAMAAAEIPVRVMFPMVTNPDEVVWARNELAAILAESKTAVTTIIPIGIMVEVPAVAVRAADFAGLVDFVSIGTNDLTQYTMAADRTNAAVSGLAKSDSAAILDLIALTAGGLPKVTIAVCGDLASRPELAATLIELGVSELSVRPPLVPLVKAAVRALK